MIGTVKIVRVQKSFKYSFITVCKFNFQNKMSENEKEATTSKGSKIEQNEHREEGLAPSPATLPPATPYPFSS